MTHVADEFSVSSLLWRAGWSPAGLLAFQKNTSAAQGKRSSQLNNTTAPQGLPATLLNFLKVNRSVTINVPGEASARCGGLILDNFETAHSSLAPCGINYASQIHQPQQPQAAAADAKNNNTNVVSNSSFSSQMMMGSSSSSSSSSFSTNRAVFDEELLRSNRARISVESAGAAPLASSGWFASSSRTGDDDDDETGGGGDDNTQQHQDNALIALRTTIWTPTPSSSSSSSSSLSGDNTEKSTKKRVMAKFSVTRTWRQFKRVASLLRELHPELLIPAFELLDGAEAFLRAQRLEFRLELARSFVSTLQRNSPIAVKSPVIVMFLLEEDREAFASFLQEMVAQNKAQEDAAIARRGISVAAMNMIGGEGGSQSSSNHHEQPGFFARLFGASSEPNHHDEAEAAAAAQRRKTAAQLQEEDMRRSMAVQIGQDIAEEAGKWHVLFSTFATVDAATQKMLRSLGGHSDALRDFVDCLAEYSDELVGTRLPSICGDADTIASSNAAAAAADGSDVSGGGGGGGGVAPSLVSPASSTNDDDHDAAGSVSASFPSDAVKQQQQQQQKTSTAAVETEGKRALRMAVMFCSCRSDSLIGASNMLTALCQSARMCMLHSQSCVAYLRQHGILAQRAAETASASHVSDESDTLLDFLIHTARPVSVEEITVAREDLRSRLHAASVLFYSLSRQLCDSVLRAEATLLHGETERAAMQLQK